MQLQTDFLNRYFINNYFYLLTGDLYAYHSLRFSKHNNLFLTLNHKKIITLLTIMMLNLIFSCTVMLYVQNEWSQLLLVINIVQV